MIKALSISHHPSNLQKINIELIAAKVTGIIGPNGAGKTSLLKILAGIMTADQGEILFDGKPLYTLKANSRAKLIGYLEQNAYVYWPLSVKQIVKLGRYPYGEDQLNDKNHPIINEVIEQVGLSDIQDKPFNQLSGGERARVLLARTLALDANILLVDEPIAALDLKYQLEIMKLLVKQSEKGKTVCIIVHDLNFAAKYCDYLYLVNNGKLHAQGTAQSVLTGENIANVYNVAVKVTTDADRISITTIE